MPLIPPFDILPLPAYLPSVEMGIRDVVSVVIVIVSLAVATISLLYCIVNQKITRFMSFIDLVQRLKKDLPLMFGDDQEVTERQNMSGKQGASGQGVIKELDDLAEGCERPVSLFHRLMFSYCEGALIRWRWPCLHSFCQRSPGTRQMFVQ